LFEEIIEVSKAQTALMFSTVES